VCVREAGFISPALLFRWKIARRFQLSHRVEGARERESRGEPREPRLFMDGFSFNFRQGLSVSFSARRPSVPSIAVGVSSDTRSDVEELAVYTMFSRLKRVGREKANLLAF